MAPVTQQRGRQVSGLSHLYCLHRACHLPSVGGDGGEGVWPRMVDHTETHPGQGSQRGELASLGSPPGGPLGQAHPHTCRSPGPIRGVRQSDLSPISGLWPPASRRPQARPRLIISGLLPQSTALPSLAPPALGTRPRTQALHPAVCPLSGGRRTPRLLSSDSWMRCQVLVGGGGRAKVGTPGLPRPPSTGPRRPGAQSAAGRPCRGPQLCRACSMPAATPVHPGAASPARLCGQWAPEAQPPPGGHTEAAFKACAPAAIEPTRSICSPGANRPFVLRPRPEGLGELGVVGDSLPGKRQQVTAFLPTGASQEVGDVGGHCRNPDGHAYPTSPGAPLGWPLLSAQGTPSRTGAPQLHTSLSEHILTQSCSACLRGATTGSEGHSGCRGTSVSLYGALPTRTHQAGKPVCPLSGPVQTAHRSHVQLSGYKTSRLIRFPRHAVAGQLGDPGTCWGCSADSWGAAWGRQRALKALPSGSKELRGVGRGTGQQPRQLSPQTPSAAHNDPAFLAFFSALTASSWALRFSASLLACRGDSVTWGGMQYGAHPRAAEFPGKTPQLRGERERGGGQAGTPGEEPLPGGETRTPHQDHMARLPGRGSCTSCRSHEAAAHTPAR